MKFDVRCIYKTGEIWEQRIEAKTAGAAIAKFFMRKMQRDNPNPINLVRAKPVD